MKNNRLEIRLSDELFKLLLVKSKASNKTNSDYIRSLITTSEIKMDYKHIKLDLIASINKVGNNINQIAKRLNYAKKTNALDKVSYKEMQEQLLVIEYYLSELLDRNS